jgi:hypothetical protein
MLRSLCDHDRAAVNQQAAKSRSAFRLHNSTRAIVFTKDYLQDQKKGLERL